MRSREGFLLCDNDPWSWVHTRGCVPWNHSADPSPRDYNVPVKIKAVTPFENSLCSNNSNVVT